MFSLFHVSVLMKDDMMMTNNHVRLFFGWSDAFVSHCRHKEEPRHWREGGRMQGLSVSSGPSDSSLGAGGGASEAVPAAVAAVEAASGLASDRRVLHARRALRAGGHAGAETGAAPGSLHAAALVASSKCLEVV